MGSTPFFSTAFSTTVWKPWPNYTENILYACVFVLGWWLLCREDSPRLELIQPALIVLEILRAGDAFPAFRSKECILIGFLVSEHAHDHLVDLLYSVTYSLLKEY